jgi:hypothetical protein
MRLNTWNKTSGANVISPAGDEMTNYAPGYRWNAGVTAFARSGAQRWEK